MFLRLLTAWAAWCFQSFPLSLSPCYQSFGSLLALLLMHKPTALHRDPLQSAARFITGCIGCCSCLDDNALIGQRSSTPEQSAGKDTVLCYPTPRRLWEKNCHTSTQNASLLLVQMVMHWTDLHKILSDDFLKALPIAMSKFETFFLNLFESDFLFFFAMLQMNTCTKLFFGDITCSR